MDVMKILGRSYPVLGQIKVKNSERTIPLVDIPMMSDERWNELAGENAVNNYRKEFGRDPESVDQAVEWQRKRVEELTGGCGK